VAYNSASATKNIAMTNYFSFQYVAGCPAITCTTMAQACSSAQTFSTVTINGAQSGSITDSLKFTQNEDNGHGPTTFCLKCESTAVIKTIDNFVFSQLPDCTKQISVKSTLAVSNPLTLDYVNDSTKKTMMSWTDFFDNNKPTECPFINCAVKKGTNYCTYYSTSSSYGNPNRISRINSSPWEIQAV
jgi:hypothetical protein